MALRLDGGRKRPNEPLLETFFVKSQRIVVEVVEVRPEFSNSLSFQSLAIMRGIVVRSTTNRCEVQLFCTSPSNIVRCRRTHSHLSNHVVYAPMK